MQKIRFILLATRFLKIKIFEITKFLSDHNNSIFVSTTSVYILFFENPRTRSLISYTQISFLPLNSQVIHYKYKLLYICRCEHIICITLFFLESLILHRRSSLGNVIAIYELWISLSIGRHLRSSPSTAILPLAVEVRGSHRETKIVDLSKLTSVELLAPPGCINRLSSELPEQYQHDTVNSRWGTWTLVVHHLIA